MREIKFRAWHMIEEWMDSAWLIDWEHGKVCHSKRNQSDLEDCILMQFTGLKDKNGTEIYEGDVIKNHTPAGENHSAYDEIGVVIWDKNRIIAERRKYGMYFPIFEGRSEVIGNVYENPELLEVNHANPIQ